MGSGSCASCARRAALLAPRGTLVLQMFGWQWERLIGELEALGYRSGNVRTAGPFVIAAAELRDTGRRSRARRRRPPACRRGLSALVLSEPQGPPHVELLWRAGRRGPPSARSTAAAGAGAPALTAARESPDCAATPSTTA